MRIRAVTVGQLVTLPISRQAVARAGAFVQDAKQAFEQLGYQVQTTRLCTQPVSRLLDGEPPEVIVDLARHLEDATVESGIDYCALGPIMAAEVRGPDPLIDQVPGVLAKTQRVFFSVMPATTRDSVNIPAVHQAARTLVQIGRQDNDGSASRRFALSANVPPHGPFFPSAYHQGRRSGFSIAIEAADLAVEAFRGARDLASAGAALRESLERHGRKLAATAHRLERHDGVAFHGLDISLAPFPAMERSIGQAIEELGVERFGAHGTLFAAAFIVDALRQVRLPKTGFSGLMVPLLEDAVMATRHTEGTFGIESLLLYSAVCGTGLDTIPIPGDASAEEIAAVYLDLCALSVALDKPLTARLMPMRDKQAGDRVTFAFPYFAPTTVTALKGAVHGALTASQLWEPGGRRG